jgi:tetratricopeptide (TPR) repeat protein
MSAAWRAIATEPNDPSIQAGAAAVAIALGDADFAVAAGARAVRLAPSVASFEQTLASGARAATDRKATLGELSSVPSLRDSRLLTVVAAEVALAAGMLEEARMYASRALELDPQDAQARELLRRAGG